MSAINQSSRRYYTTPAAIEEYEPLESLWKPERVLFERHRDALAGAVLDLGMGAGRTTRHLLAGADRYVGLDYSPAMVEACRRAFPDGDFQVGDAADLSRFDDHSFDAVVFSFNGIDCVDHDSRLRILAEVRRVLRPTGRFVFSFHSRDAAGRIKAVRLTRRPDLAWVRTSVRGLRSYLRVRRHQVVTDRYEIVSDPEGCFGCMAYFITKRDQAEQLEEAGFGGVEIIDFQGEPAPIDELDRDSFWFYVTCQPTSSG